ncbi:HAD family hydrolase [Actinopolyspora halophila]|uniref:HAD family hydrolase n=1 Tax=Actinopolyspora halophila TaxID=1850 RepID=UPI00037279F2|nr:HAD family phosphatase [Actinopolyspora halophila]
MPASPEPPRWVVFDYGGVISRPTDALPRIAAELGLDDPGVAEVTAAYFAERDAYDRGRVDHEYWKAVAGRLDRTVDAALAEKLTRIDIAGWSEFDPGTLALLRDLGARSSELALLSNAPTTFARSVERMPWTRHFRRLLFSGDLGTAKPDEGIWRILLDRLGVTPGQCLFFDDGPANVEAARRAGLEAELWRGPEHAREVLRSRGVSGLEGAP